MPKKTIQRFIPKTEDLKASKHLKFFGEWLHNPNLWHLNRRSAAGAFAIGLFVAFIPLPSQMIIAAALAILFKVNLPLSVALVWVSNPFTIPAIFYFCYLVGASILGKAITQVHIEFSWEGIEHLIATVGPSFLLGSLVCGIFFSICGYFSINALWRYSVRRRYRKRR
ncbi:MULTISPECIES: DUF2062 domain-containing protein [Agarivorans]|jgi:uncharacterized protein (DUF2062 family)|uniref:ATP-binding protein n=1 Tax=Agarivorans gilvus TaxID=680279 RepID=A0ABQ1I6I4_9ALTE|nr:DUF2062 domain-containing protein [Agarivorans gilvus]GGB16080.1 ATP-binding protein [Agarivorans gilvus]